MGRRGFSKSDIEKMKQSILELIKNGVTKTGACQKVNIDRSTLNFWEKQDLQFQHQIRSALHIGEEVINDLAESQKIKKIKEGDIRMILYQLNKRDRVKPNKQENMITVYYPTKDTMSAEYIHRDEHFKALEEIKRLRQKLREKPKK